MSSFGEIIEPNSRTTWEDWDDEIPDNNGNILQWHKPLVIPDEVDALFILEGKYLSDCISLQHNSYIEIVNSILEGNLLLFEIKSSNRYVCTIKDYKLLQSSEIVELLKPLITKSKDVITIQTKPLTEYQTDTIMSQSLVLRKINTAVSKKSDEAWNLNFPRLEQPNILCGVNAGVICLRDHFDLPATALVYFIEHSEEYQTDEIPKLLEHLKIVQNCNCHPNSILNSNLYI